MARRISGVGWVTVSLRRSMARLVLGSSRFMVSGWSLVVMSFGLFGHVIVRSGRREGYEDLSLSRTSARRARNNGSPGRKAWVALRKIQSPRGATHLVAASLFCALRPGTSAAKAGFFSSLTAGLKACSTLWLENESFKHLIREQASTWSQSHYTILTLQQSIGDQLFNNRDKPFDLGAETL